MSLLVDRTTRIADSWVAIDFETASLRGTPCAVRLAEIEKGRIAGQHAWLIRPRILVAGREGFARIRKKYGASLAPTSVGELQQAPLRFSARADRRKSVFARPSDFLVRRGRRRKELGVH